MKIKDLPSHEQPREKLIKLGTTNLKDKELLAILLRIGHKGKNVVEVAGELLQKYPKKILLTLTYEQLIGIKGIDSAKACTLLAAGELVKRALRVEEDGLPVLEKPQDFALLLSDIQQRKKEHLIAFYLNARYQLLARETISVGTLTESMVHPREVFEPALRHLAAFVVIAHNHPSGDPAPSPADKQITQRLIKTGQLLGIEVLDHLIITKNGYLSFKESALI